MKKLLAYCFCLFVFLANAQEQNIRYQEKPLSDVIRDLEQRFQVRFSYNTATLQGIFISYNGMATLSEMLSVIEAKQQVEITEIDAENFVITEAAAVAKDAIRQYSLDEVVIVSEYVTSGFDQNKINKAITLQPNKLNILAGLTEPDILQSLQRIPGISSPTESASALHIRGGTPDQNLVLFDGITMYHGGHFFGMISPFNPHITERVDVFKSGASTKYGSRVAGIIDMQSFGKVPDEFSGGIGTTTINADAFVKVPIIKDTLGIIVSGRRSLTDVWDSFTFNSLSDRVFQHTKIEEINNIRVEEELNILENKFYFTDFFGKILYQPHEDHKLSVSTLLINNSLNHASENVEREGSADALKLQNNGLSFQWNGKYGDSWETDLKVQYSKYELENTFRDFVAGVDNESYRKENIINDFGGIAQVSYRPKKAHTFTVGYEFSDYKVNYDIIEAGQDFTGNEIVRSEQTVHSAFTEYKYADAHWFLRVGLRGNYFSDFQDIYLEPRLYGEYAFDDYWKVKASAELRNQAISQLLTFEFNELGLSNEIWALADKEDVPILSNRQITTGFEFAKNGWKLDVEGYYKRIKGLTSFTRGFRTANQIAEDYISGNSTVYGVDVLVKKRIKKTSFWLGYSLSQNDFRFPNLQAGTFFGNFDQRHVLSLSNTFNYKNFEFAFGWQYTTGKPFTQAADIIEFTDDEGNTDVEIIYEDQNNKRLPAYHRLDASVLYDFYLQKEKNIKARFGVSVINLYNRENEIDKLYRVEGDTTQQLVEQTDIGLGTTLNMVFRVNF
ncbi:TonB-dependent siderophore receptor [uncultured Kordia sp.]|uniref:TonB-dependent receptor plug domain-containing protein n=1 Tax=uncultured Kordia sp. TaxID=507699 RepID=UPI00261E492E|nr:TonB-dependent receptor plug domain-containing protein [uncultured Kordia sp.]